MIVLSLWLNNSKPPNGFFEKTFDELICLKDITIKLVDHDVQIRCQAGLFDLPAKAMILKIKQFNGRFGCVYATIQV